ncbi:pyridoxamine 5'-phosphate oxidase family protein [Actinopolymorpha singaporensis]
MRKHLRECLIGRVLFVDSLLLAAHPVRYVVEGTCILFRTDHGAKLRAADRHKMLVFDIDSITGHGWSVLASGFAEHVTDPYEVRRLSEIVPIPWAPADRTDVIRLFVDLIQGRRYGK